MRVNKTIELIAAYPDDRNFMIFDFLKKMYSKIVMKKSSPSRIKLTGNFRDRRGKLPTKILRSSPKIKRTEGIIKDALRLALFIMQI